MKKKHGVFFGFALLLITAIFTLAGCDKNGGGEDIWLADVSNPFLGRWQSNIPSMGNATGFFEFKDDGAFTVEFPNLPEEMGGSLGPFTGGYLVKDGVQVTFLSTDEGIGGFTFRVVDNNTILVSEADNDGSLTAGNNAPFTRVSNSPVNKENKPFALTNDLIGGTWSETTSGYNAQYSFNADGTGTLSYNGGGGGHPQLPIRSSTMIT